MTLDEDDVRRVLANHWQRCAMARAIGGVALMHVVDGVAVVPVGWVLDQETCYYVPPSFVIGEGLALQ